MKYATFDSNGELSGRYDSRINHAIPADAIELSEALWLATIREADGVWCLIDGVIEKRPLTVVQPDYGKIVAAERFKREAIGVVVSGMQIETTRDSQALIASTGLSAILDPEYRCNFKTLTGFVEIGAAQIIEIAKAVRTHVQACFDRELALLRAIEAGEYRDDMLSEGWPNSSLPEPVELQ